MKKFLCILLAALLCLPLLVACGKKETGDNTPANGTPEQTAEERQAAERAAAENADKTAIAAAFNAQLQMTPAGAEGGAEGGEAQPAPTPLAMIESLLTTAETLVSNTDAEVKFGLDVFDVTYHILFAVKNGVVYGNVDDNPAWLTLNKGVLSGIGGLPQEERQWNLMQLLSSHIPPALFYTVGEVELTPEQANEALEMLPRLTVADLTAAGNGVYVLTDDYITRFVLAVTAAATNAMTPEAPEAPEAPEQPLDPEAVAAQAEMEKQQADMIAKLVPALGLKIGFKLSGTAIAQCSLNFEYTEATAAAMAALSVGPQMGPGPDAPEAEPDENENEGEGEDENEGEGMLPVGTKVDLVLSLDANNLPTSVSATVTVPEVANATFALNAAYTDAKVLTSLNASLDAMLYNMEYASAQVVPAGERELVDLLGKSTLTARILADTTVHAELVFAPANVLLQNAGKPITAELAASYGNVQYQIDGQTVENLNDFELYYEHDELNEPANARFTLDSENNGQGTIRLTACMDTADKPLEISSLDIQVGSAPDFVAQADSPFTAVSAVVQRVMGRFDPAEYRERYAYDYEGYRYYFYVYADYDYNEEGEPLGGYTVKADFMKRVAVDAVEQPYDTYVLVTVAGNELVLTPVDNGNQQQPQPQPQPQP